MTAKSYEPAIGRALPLRDARERVTGRVKFTIDHTVPNMAYGRVIRSPLPHASIKSIDTSAALEKPGVIAVLTGDDLGPESGIDPIYGANRADQPVVALDKVRYVGDAVAVVIAETQECADRAIHDVWVDYEELPFVTDAESAALPEAPVIHDEWPDNGCGEWYLERGNLEQGWAEADRIYESVYTSPSASHAAMEPHVSIASVGPDGVDIWSSTQSPYGVQRGIMKMLGRPAEEVRVRAFNLGGGYGGKGSIKLEPLAVCSAIKAGRPVRILLSREEVFHTIAKHQATVRIKTGVKLDGTFIAREVDILWNAGAYAVSSPRASRQGLVRAPGPYRTPHISVRSRAFYTNTVPTGPFRGAMTSQVCWAYEQQADDIAHDLDIDPIELRRRNLLRPGDSYATGEKLTHVHFHELLDNVSQAIDWHHEDGQVRKVAADDDVARGKGVAILIKHTVTPSRSEARLVLRPDRKLEAHFSSVEMGQGARTTMLQYVADEFGVAYEDVISGQPDTGITPFDTTTSSSRTSYAMSSALRSASDNLKDLLRDLASDVLEVSPQDVEVEQGLVRVKGAPSTAVPVEEVLRANGLDSLTGDGFFATAGNRGVLDERGQGVATDHWHEGAVGVEVEVNTRTGKITIMRCHAASYAGRVLNPVNVRQQNEGNVIMGTGPALFEEYVYDNGQLVNPNLSDYQIPSFLDIPTHLTSDALVSSSPDAEIHGIGEMTLPVLAPAIGNAVFHATGVRMRDLPMTAERVFRALHGHQEEEKS